MVLVIGAAWVGCGGSAKVENLEREVNAEVFRFGPVLRLEQREVELGSFVDGDEIVGPVFFENPGSEDLFIRKITSTCACLSGVTGDRRLVPGGAGVLEVEFDSLKIPAGRVSRVVRLESNDPEQKAVEVVFNFAVARSGAQEDRRILQNELGHLRREVQLLRADMRKVLDKLEGRSAEGQPAAKSKGVPDTNVYDVPIGDSPVRGKADAAVTIVEFVDMQCPYCVREYPKLNQLLDEYPEDVRLVVKHYPLKFHDKAKAAHAALELTQLEKGADGFWRMYDMVMARPDELEVERLREYAGELGIDMKKFDEVVGDEERMDTMLAADMEAARRCRVRGTPTVFINGLKQESRSIEAYRKRIAGCVGNSKRSFAK